MAAEPGSSFGLLTPGSLFTSVNRASSVLVLAPDCFGKVNALIGHRGSRHEQLGSPRKGFALTVLTSYSVDESLVAQWHPQDISDFQVLGPCIALKREYVGFGYTACRGELTENDKLQEQRTEKAAGAGYILGFDTKEKAEYFTQVLACRLNSDDSCVQVKREKAEPNNVFLYRTIKRGSNHRINNEKLKNARVGLVEFAKALGDLAKHIEIVPCHSVYRVTNASDVRNS